MTKLPKPSSAEASAGMDGDAQGGNGCARLLPGKSTAPDRAAFHSPRIPAQANGSTLRRVKRLFLSPQQNTPQRFAPPAPHVDKTVPTKRTPATPSRQQIRPQSRPAKRAPGQLSTNFSCFDSALRSIHAGFGRSDDFLSDLNLHRCAGCPRLASRAGTAQSSGTAAANPAASRNARTTHAPHPSHQQPHPKSRPAGNPEASYPQIFPVSIARYATFLNG